MPEAIPRAVVDTNVWISAFINPKGVPASVLAALREGRFETVVSEALLDELRAVAVSAPSRAAWPPEERW